jgi:hypothetical protein
MRLPNFVARLSVAVLASFTLPVWAQAEPAKTASPVYAVLSLIGDRLDIVVRQPQIGSRVDQNRRDIVPVSDAAFDNAAVSAAAQAIRAARSNAEVSHLNTRSPVLFEKTRELFDLQGDTLTMPGAIRDALVAQGATHLLLITKRRDEAKFRYGNGGYEGAGNLEGLGFYLDTSTQTSYVTDSGQRANQGTGFIAPYAFIQVQLVAFPSGKLLGAKAVTDYQMVGAGVVEQGTSEPWSAMSATAKARAVATLVLASVTKATGEVMAAAGNR